MIRGYNDWKKLNESSQSGESMDRESIESRLNTVGGYVEDIEWTEYPGDEVQLTFDTSTNNSNIKSGATYWTITFKKIGGLDAEIRDLFPSSEALIPTECEVNYTFREIQSDEYDCEDVAEDVEVNLVWKKDMFKTLDELEQMIDDDLYIWAWLDDTGKIDYRPLKNWTVNVDHRDTGSDSSRSEVTDLTIEAFLKIKDDYAHIPDLIGEFQKTWGISQADIDDYLSRNS